MPVAEQPVDLVPQPDQVELRLEQGAIEVHELAALPQRGLEQQQQQRRERRAGAQKSGGAGVQETLPRPPQELLSEGCQCDPR